MAEAFDNATPSPLLDADRSVIAICRALGDPLRATVMRLLARDSFNVREMCDILNVAQSALSHHLKLLANAGLVDKRREANSTFYRRANVASQDPTRALASSLFASLDQEPLPTSCVSGIDRVVAERRQRSQAFFSAEADALANQQAQICQSDVYAPLLQALAEELTRDKQRALEIGPGDCSVLRGLCEQFGHVTAIDSVDTMLTSAYELSREADNLEVINRTWETLEGSRRFDLIAAAMVLHHIAQPQAFFEQARRLLKEDGVLLIAELDSHEQHWVVETCGDHWLGFHANQLDSWAREQGLVLERDIYLAQRNGFRVQARAYRAGRTTTFNDNPHPPIESKTGKKTP